MARSGSSETGLSAEHLLHDPWRNTAGAQQEQCTAAFDLENFELAIPTRVLYVLISKRNSEPAIFVGFP